MKSSYLHKKTRELATSNSERRIYAVQLPYFSLTIQHRQSSANFRNLLASGSSACFAAASYSRAFFSRSARTSPPGMKLLAGVVNIDGLSSTLIVRLGRLAFLLRICLRFNKLFRTPHPGYSALLKTKAKLPFDRTVTERSKPPVLHFLILNPAATIAAAWCPNLPKS